ncbi:MAG: hypothetical protein Q4P26_04145 [Lachnospiraceae bacterium]|nr:hypothetical protein [Lachnospiraceae bacterium]
MEFQKIERKETKESPLTRFLAFSSVSVIVTGPFSCVCFAEGAALKKEERKRLFLCEMKQSDYITGASREKVLQAAKRAEQVPGVEQIVVYQCCTDYLTHMDYETYLTQYFIALKRNIRVYTFQRGSASLNYSRKKEVAEQVKTDAERIAIRRKEEADFAAADFADGTEVRSLQEKEKRMSLTQAGSPEIQQKRRIADFAAVCSRLQNTGTLICIFSPGSCTGALDVAGLKNYERIYMSRLTDSELITGCSRAFAEEAAHLAEEISTEHIALIGTPVTRLLYTDFKEAAEILKAQGFLVELFDTSGYETTE